MTTKLISVGQLAPDFTLPSTGDEKSLSLSALRGKVVVLAFHVLDFTGT